MEQKEEYNVIWIDDQCKEDEGFAPGFIKRCKLRFNIHLFPFELESDGLTILENDTEHYDAVILDAKGWSDVRYVATTTKGMYEAIRRIERLAYKKVIPYYILTAQEDLLSSEDFTDSVGKNKIYYKYSPSDIENLLKNIQLDVKANRRNQVKLYYMDALSCITAMNPKSGEIVLDILDAMHFPNNHPDFDPILYYNPLRQILEYNFRAANRVCIIPNECLDKKGYPNLSQCCHYLSGNNADVAGVRCGIRENNDRVVPPHIELMMRMILDVGNINSHSTELSNDELQKLEQYINKNVFSSRYLIYGLALNACEITLWMKKYIDCHQDIETNKKKCRSLKSEPLIEEKNVKQNIDKDELVGIVEYNNGIYHIGDRFYVNSGTIEKNGWQNKKVKIVQYDVNTRSGIKEKYPLFACRVEPIQD